MLNQTFGIVLHHTLLLLCLDLGSAGALGHLSPVRLFLRRCLFKWDPDAAVISRRLVESLVKRRELHTLFHFADRVLGILWVGQSVLKFLAW